MVYHASDARAALRQAGDGTPAPARATGQAAPAEYVPFPDVPPHSTGDGGRTWFARGQNLVVGYTEVADETTVALPAGPDEHALLLPEDTVGAVVETGGERTEIAGHTLTFLPPGAAEITLRGRGRAVTLGTTRCAELAARAVNADSYATAHPHVTPLTPWPEPVGGHRVRTYRLDVPGLENPPFRIFRCSSFMVNVPHRRSGPRDTTRLSPHTHDDFEQFSLVIDGDYTHHLRWPWTTDLSEWREDQHLTCQAPSLTVIPPTVVHTSQGTGAGVNHLLDLFSPPRADFSRMPGWVLNADDYPMPDQG
ncbi:hypothetical protein [Streptomyces tagetis]|uniref:Uncharacterized protein n=1 Tax=Streptomyces tagetis TaxID=2820809 RepID=A0A940XHA5_9ACTN|nr:hypothetical protein [Streptomyces sp. RG38]MBQ0826536.1 hypothetical protein [Streptomyces sp. RG38]